MKTPLTEAKADAKALRLAFEDLPGLIADFQKATGVSDAKLGYLSVGYPSIVLKIRRGAHVRTDTLVKLLKFMEDYDASAA